MALRPRPCALTITTPAQLDQHRNRGALLGFIAGLLVVIGLTEGGTVERLSKPLYRIVLRILRPAESAARLLSGAIRKRRN